MLTRRGVLVAAAAVAGLAAAPRAAQAQVDDTGLPDAKPVPGCDPGRPLEPEADTALPGALVYPACGFAWEGKFGPTGPFHICSLNAHHVGFVHECSCRGTFDDGPEEMD